MNFAEQEIRLLTMKQPYAGLILEGKLETRTWYTPYRGLVLISASQKPYSWDQVRNISGEMNFNRILEWAKDEGRGHEHLCGYAFILAELVGCRLMENPRISWFEVDEDLPHEVEAWKKTEEYETYVEWQGDLYVWEFRNVRPIIPFPIKGAQGLRRVGPELRRLIRIANPEIPFAAQV